MTDTVLLYSIVIIAVIIAIFACIIGSEKMIKVILGNYILGTLCLAANQSLDILVHFLQTSTLPSILGFVPKELAQVLDSSSMVIIVLLYLGLFFLMYHKSTIHMRLPSDQILQKSLYIFLVPLMVVSILLTLEIVFFGINSLSSTSLQNFAHASTQNPYLIQAIILTPVWMLLHGLVTVIISLEVKLSIRSGL